MVVVLKSDDAAKIGQHVFERAGFGKRPYTLVGFHTAKFQVAPDAPVLPGSSCDYCSQAIMYVCELQSSDGRTFKVGCDCIERAGDRGLIRAYKTHKEYRALAALKRKARDVAITGEWQQMMADEAVKAKLAAYRVPAYRGGTEPWLSLAQRAWGYCGASG